MEIKPGMKNLWSIAGGSELTAMKKDKNGWWCEWHDGKETRTDFFIDEELTDENPNEPEAVDTEELKKKKRR